MIALPENAIEPAVASARPGQRRCGRGTGVVVLERGERWRRVGFRGHAPAYPPRRRGGLAPRQRRLRGGRRPCVLRRCLPRLAAVAAWRGGASDLWELVGTAAHRGRADARGRPHHLPSPARGRRREPPPLRQPKKRRGCGAFLFVAGQPLPVAQERRRRAAKPRRGDAGEHQRHRCRVPARPSTLTLSSSAADVVGAGVVEAEIVSEPPLE